MGATDPEVLVEVYAHCSSMDVLVRKGQFIPIFFW